MTAPPTVPPRPVTDRNRWDCRTCKMSMSTDNATRAVCTMWAGAHAAHDHEVSARHDGDNSQEAPRVLRL